MNAAAVVSFDGTGEGSCFYTELIDLHAIGSLYIRRASFIEFSNERQMWEVKNELAGFCPSRSTGPRAWPGSGPATWGSGPLRARRPHEGTGHSVREGRFSRNDPLEALLAVPELPEQSIVLLRDFHLFLTGDPNPVLVGQAKDVLRQAKIQSKALVILGCRVVPPPELEREFTLVEFALTGRDLLEVVLAEIMKSAGLTEFPEAEAALSVASWLTTAEAENAFALSVASVGRICPTVIAREKANAIPKSGLLEVIEPAETMESVGGLDLLKAWILKRRHAFSARARAYGLPMPEGVLIVGVPSTDKSLTAKVTAKALGVPLLKLDVGRIFGGLVGQSEGNLRSVLQTAKAIAP